MHKVPALLATACLLFSFASYAAPSNAKSALAEASAKGQFWGLIFYEAQDASLTAMLSFVKTFNKSSTKKIVAYNANLSDPANQELGGKYGIQRGGDLPMLLVIAPNGAITGGFSKTVTADQLKKSISISDLMLRTIKSLQEEKVTLVSLQNHATKFNAESWKGVSDFVNDSNYKEVAVAVKADPLAAGSQEFIKQCQLIAPLTEATVIILVPPGRISKVFTGKVTKADILKSLQSCSPGGGSGCCSDRRLKKNIAPLASALDKVIKLQGVNFSWDRAAYPKRFFPEGTQIGLIAQDVESVIPEVVLTDSEGYKSITYDKLTAVLIEAVKEMKQQMRSQDSTIKAQNKRIEVLEAQK